MKSLVATTDVTNREQLKSLVVRAERELGPAEILIECMGVTYYTMV